MQGLESTSSLESGVGRSSSLPQRNSSSSSSLSSKKQRVKALLQSKDEQIAALQSQIQQLTQQLSSPPASHNNNTHNGNHKRPLKKHHQLAPHAVHVQHSSSSDSSTRRLLTNRRVAMGRKASVATRQVLQKLQQDSQPSPQSLRQQDLCRKLVKCLQDPHSFLDYLNGSREFLQDLQELLQYSKVVLEEEPRVVFLQSPAYILGDLHGNLEDLHFFSDNLWRLGLGLTAGNFVFLGDYVDRGMQSLEVVAYVLALKVLYPHKVFLLRGNHETRDVSGWEEHYGARSFLAQCRARFGDDNGYRVWEYTNQVFDRLPLAAVLDQDVFCVHGGIPRPLSLNSNRIRDILKVPAVAGINPPYQHETDQQQQVASDCIWSDPASEHQEVTSVDPATGFGESLRGGGAICFGTKAVTEFLQQQGFSYILRAHEAHAEGVSLSKGARVFTVFSTSKDHNQGAHAMAGCILVDYEKLQVINRSPAYKNQYVHRRDSVSLNKVSEVDIQKRMKLGLVEEPAAQASHEEDDEEVWEDLDPDDESEEEEEERGGQDDYCFDLHRRSSVDLNSTSENVHDSISTIDSTELPPASSGLVVDFEASSSATHRQWLSSRKPRVSSIHEGLEDDTDEAMDQEEVETVDGNEADGWEHENGLSSC